MSSSLIFEPGVEHVAKLALHNCGLRLLNCEGRSAVLHLCSRQVFYLLSAQMKRLYELLQGNCEARESQDILYPDINEVLELLSMHFFVRALDRRKFLAAEDSDRFLHSFLTLLVCHTSELLQEA